MSYTPTWAIILSAGVVVIAPLAAAIYKDWSMSRSLKKAIQAEVSSIKVAADKRGYRELLKENIKDHPEPIFVPIPKSYNKVFTSNTDKIGMLNKQLAAEITIFYQLISGLVADMSEKGALANSEVTSTDFADAVEFYDEAMRRAESILQY